MRIQHNIMAMSAYRNYTNNVSAMKKNLEKLSSGYKINRAGDDAAGLAISEKMRAQITGLETAQKNAKDGISLVQTAEGALTEVHDMLNRMVELATQSANGTYDGTDRDQLQKEVDQLLAEINRIADSSNFNGIQLLDGSMDGDALGKVLASGADRIISTVYNAAQHGNGITDVQDLAGKYTFLDGEGVEAKATKFYVDLNKLTAVGETTGTMDNTTAAKPSLNGNAVDTAVVDNDALKAAIESDENFDAADFENATDIKLEWNNADSKWYITAGANVKIEADVEADSTAGTATVKVGATTVATYATTAGNKGDATVDNMKAAFNAATAFGPQYTGPAAKPTVSLTVGTDTIVDDLEVNPKDDATKLANAIAKDIADNQGGVVTINGAEWKVTQGTGENKDKLVFELNEDPTANNIKGNFDWEVTVADGSVDGLHTGGTTVVDQGAVEQVGTTANTVFEVKTDDLVDGATITIDGQTVTLAVGEASKVDTSKDNVVNLKDMEEGAITAAQLNVALGRISEKYADGTKNFIVGVNDGTGATTADAKVGLTIQKKDSSEQTYDTKEKLEAVFSVNAPKDAKDARGLTLQLGDTAATYNQLTVNIKDCHAEALGIKGLKIDTQDNALASIDKIKSAINYVSDVRGTLGATQNRLDHTINNLSVMTENIQDAESTIRDTDVAEEMMAYTKNNILIQSAQAMLAQANQVPQGVLQLLQ